VLFVGNDWSEGHHDVWLMGEAGEKLVARRLSEGVEGLAEFHDLVAGFVSDPFEVKVGVETDRGLWVQALVAAGYEVYAVNPKSAARYRERHSVSGAKSDTADAKMLADLVRTDRHNHRVVAADSSEVGAVQVLARAHQNLIWERKRHSNRLRSGLREYHPAALATFGDLTHPDALSVLAAAATPAEGADLTAARVRAALKKGGRQRNLDKAAIEIAEGLAQQHLKAPSAVEAALAATTRATVAIIVELNHQIGILHAQMTEHFEQHPDAPIYLSMPGMSITLGARVLGEFGDDPNRYPHVKSRRNYAATSPITRASGNSRIVAARWVRNNRLHDPLIRWAFCSISASPGARAFYDQRRARGDTHNQALRALANRLVGILHGCLRTRTSYNEDTAWAHRQPATANIAA
jgi:transposase